MPDSLTQQSMFNGQVLPINTYAPVIGARPVPFVSPSANQEGEYAATCNPRYVPTSGATTANRTTYMRVIGETQLLVAGLRIVVVNQSGNVGVGVYSNSGSGALAAPGAQRATSGSVACAAPGIQTIPFLAVLDSLSPGDWIGFWCDNATATFARPSNPTVALPELAQFQAAVMLPNPAVPAGGASAVTFWVST